MPPHRSCRTATMGIDRGSVAPQSRPYVRDESPRKRIARDAAGCRPLKATQAARRPTEAPTDATRPIRQMQQTPRRPTLRMRHQAAPASVDAYRRGSDGRPDARCGSRGRCRRPKGSRQRPVPRRLRHQTGRAVPRALRRAARRRRPAPARQADQAAHPRRHPGARAGVFTKRVLGFFFSRYTTTTPYLKALAHAPHRFDLDGQPAGDIDDVHRQAAVEEVARRRAIAIEKRAAERRAAPRPTMRHAKAKASARRQAPRLPASKPPGATTSTSVRHDGPHDGPRHGPPQGPRDGHAKQGATHAIATAPSARRQQQGPPTIAPAMVNVHPVPPDTTAHRATHAQTPAVPPPAATRPSAATATTDVRAHAHKVAITTPGVIVATKPTKRRYRKTRRNATARCCFVPSKAAR